MNKPDVVKSTDEIAVIGMSGRFPGAKNLQQFWQNLQNGVDSISFFTDEELAFSGIDKTTLNHPNYVKAGAVLQDIDLFDASFFGFSPREAEITDPQQRLFLECAWEALETAGYDCATYQGQIGVYAGVGLSTYTLFNLYPNQEFLDSTNGSQALIKNDKDFLSTYVSYKFNLKGPSISIQTACSTSLVAVHFACQSLLNGECDMALAGGVRVRSQQRAGYYYQEGGISSPDGHCRAFDAKAQGTVSGNGVGVVVLKRLEDALADGDCIHAVIKGSAINNDGSLKVGYTAPSVEGQAQVIAQALAVAGISPETVSYVEAHGTGTNLGDPIEMAALNQVFRNRTNKKHLCAVGSLKTNIGHLDAAAGVAGLIKTVLALKHKLIPPSLHFESPNPQIDFANSPFYVNNTLSEWKANGNPRRAGVSSFGIGGTNAHVIVEEAPIVDASGSSRPWQLLVLSAKTSSALEIATRNIVEHLKHNVETDIGAWFQMRSQSPPENFSPSSSSSSASPALQVEINLADVAYTLGVGRSGFDYRRMVVCRNLNDAIESLSLLEPQRVLTRFQKPCNRPVVFMFPGQGAQYVNMGKELYQVEPVFREVVERCSTLLEPHLGLNLCHVLYPTEEQTEVAAQQLQQTCIAQPALFVVEYALAQLWMGWGVYPEAMIGHSIGEYAAACLAGVFSLEDALALVARRGQLMQQLPSGAMLSVQLSPSKVQPLLEKELSLAASNAPASCVVSGSTNAIERLQQRLQDKGISCRQLLTSHAFHSQMMEPIIEPFIQSLRKVNLNSPRIPFLSNVSGTWISIAEATDPSYWVQHLRQPVCFSEGLTELLKEPELILLEVGPGRTLSTFALRHQADDLVALTSLCHPQEQTSDVRFLLNSLGQLWLVGVPVDWSSFYAGERRSRIPLPTYPFERQRYWVEPNLSAVPATVRQEPLSKKPNIADWFYVPVWKQSLLLEPFENGERMKPSPHPQGDEALPPLVEQKSCWLVFVDACGVGWKIAKRLEQQGKDAIAVIVGEQFTKVSDHSYTINPQQRDDYDALLQALHKQGLTPRAIGHFWSLIPNAQIQSRTEFFENCQNLGFWSLLFLAQALGEQQTIVPLNFLVVTNEIHNVTGDEELSPEKVTVLGPCKVIPQEYPNISSRSVDIVIPESGTWQEETLIDQLLSELAVESSDLCIAYRGQHRWAQTFEAVHWEGAIAQKTRLRQGGVYLITGGLGGMGMALAEHLAKTVRAKLVLIGRSAFPLREEWEQWLATHDEFDQVSRKIRNLQALEELGASVLICRADVADKEQMQEAIAKASSHFGEIHGVIHAAGIGGGGLIQFQTPEKVASVFASKVIGTQVLDELFQDVHLDFLVLCSSQRSILGAPGRIEYCAANAFLDAFAHRNTFRHRRFTVSINWGNWLEVGMSVDERLRRNFKPEDVLRNAMSSKEGVDAFSRILCRTLPQVVVSPEDFLVWIEQSHNNSAFSVLEKIEKARSSPPAHPRPQLSNTYVAPINKVEQILADIWQQLLGIEQVGIYDNFFDFGGDSVVGIQVSARANQAGIQITSRQIFEHQTIIELAEAARVTQVIQAEQGLVKGSLPLAPNQQWFLEQNQSNPHHWNMAVGLEMPQAINPVLLQQGVRELLSHHDALRLRFVRSESSWQQVNASTDEVIPFIQLDFSAMSPDEQKLAMKVAAAELQASLNLSQGPIVRVAFFDLGEHQPNRLLIVIHHLAVDVVSWRILLEDLQTAYQQLSRGEAIQLPQKTTSFKQWSERLTKYAVSAKLQPELDYWLSKPCQETFCLPIDYLGGANTVASAQTVSVELSLEETKALLQEVPAVYQTQTEEVLLTALVQAYAQWTGVHSLLVALEGRGREVLFEDIDLSRTVGWFTTLSPVLLNLAEIATSGEALKAVKEQLRGIPNEGIGYGVLHYLSSDATIAKKLQSRPQAEVIFLYLGQFAQTLPESSLFKLTQEFNGSERSPQGTRSHLLEVNSWIDQGQLRSRWTYSKNIHRRVTIENLAQGFIEALRVLITHCRSPEAGDYTPSDFATARISQGDLSQLLAQASQSQKGGFDER